MKKKIILSIAFIISLLPMFLNQYGGLKGVQEITGLINLLNPIGMVSVILFAVGVWFPFKEQVVGKSLGALGTIGIVVSEIYKFFTWHVMNITGEVSIHKSITQRARRPGSHLPHRRLVIHRLYPGTVTASNAPSL